MQVQRSSVQAGSVRAAGTRRAAAVSVRAQAVAVSAGAKVVVKETGSVSLRGTVRKVNEDRFDIKVSSRWGTDGCRFSTLGGNPGNVRAYLSNSYT